MTAGATRCCVGRAAFGLVAEATGDRGLGPVIAAHPELVREVTVDVAGGNPDIDTRADLVALLESAWAARVRANAEQVDRFREVPDGTDFYAPVTGLFRADPRGPTSRHSTRCFGWSEPGETWLDIGAGAGRYALPVAPGPGAIAAGEVIALDASAAMLDASARDRRPSTAIDNVDVVETRWPPAATSTAASRPMSRSSPMSATTSRRSGRSSARWSRPRERLCVAVLMERQPSSIADACWPPVHGEARVSLPALPEFVELLRARGRSRRSSGSSASRGGSRRATSSRGSFGASCGPSQGARRTAGSVAALDELMTGDDDGRVGLRGQRPLPIGIVTWAPRGTRLTGPETAPDGRPMAGPFDRAGWRAWLIANHAASRACISCRGVAASAGQRPVRGGRRGGALRRLDRLRRSGARRRRSIQWFSPRRSGSGWARSNKERVARLTAAGQMLPAGLAAIEEAKRNGSWTLLDDVEDLVVPDDLAAAWLPSRRPVSIWDAFSRSRRRAMLQWIVEAKRPETRAKRIAEAAEHAARNEPPPQFRPRD